MKDVTGDIFPVRVEASKIKNDLFSSTRKVQILMFAGSKQYSTSSFYTLNAGGTFMVEFSFEGNEAVEASVIDVETKEQLDSVTIKKSIARDLGGLS